MVSWAGIDGFHPDHFNCEHFACEDDSIRVLTKFLGSREIGPPAGRVTEERIMFYFTDDAGMSHLDRVYYHATMYELETEPVEHYLLGNIQYTHAACIKVDSDIYATQVEPPPPTDSAKYIVKDAIDGVATTIDNNATAATILYLYEGGPETLKYLLMVLDFDVVVTFADPEVRSQRDIQDVPLHYPAVIPVTVTSIDKSGVTASKMQQKMRDGIRTAIEAQAQMPNYTLKILRESSSVRRKGGIDRVWETTHYVEHVGVGV